MRKFQRLSLRAWLTLRYALALGLVAALTLVSYGLVERTVNTEILDVDLINLAGRQRMLCQRVGALAMRASEAQGQERRARLFELDQAVAQLDAGHRRLVHGPAKELGLDKDSPALKILRTDPEGEALMHGFLSEALALRGLLEAAAGRDSIRGAQERLNGQGDRLLAHLDGHMDALQQLGGDTLRSFTRLMLLLATGTLAGLCVTALYIFRPMVVEVVRTQEHLESINRSLSTQASTDTLTGALNRRAWEVEVSRALAMAERRQSPVCLILTDLDHFKRVNDAFGHQRGDRVLQDFTVRLRQTVRASDGLFRLGGEEFALLLADTGLEAGQLTAEKLRERVAARPLDGDLAITASFGVSVSQGRESPDELFRRADLALYAAKSGGRNRVEVQARTT